MEQVLEEKIHTSPGAERIKTFQPKLEVWPQDLGFPKRQSSEKQAMGDKVVGNRMMGEKVVGDKMLGDKIMMGDNLMGDKVMGDKVPRFPEPGATREAEVEAAAPPPGFQRLKPNSFLLLGTKLL